MALRSVAVVCFLLAAELHLSACWLKTPKNLARSNGGWSDLSLEEEHVPMKDALKSLSKVGWKANLEK